jgi:hypothetical protein
LAAAIITPPANNGMTVGSGALPIAAPRLGEVACAPLPVVVAAELPGLVAVAAEAVALETFSE